MSSLTSLDDCSFIRPSWPAPANVVAYSTTRIGGVSRAPFNGLNVGKHVGDDPVSVDRNRSLLPHSKNMLWLKQTHSNACVNLPIKPTSLVNDSQEADCAYTQQPHQVCAVMTADCLPVLLCNKQGNMVAAVHAGWRGLAGGIIEACIEQFDCERQDILVWLGPAIGANHFEVGQDVKDAFAQYPQGFREKKHVKHPKYLMDIFCIAKTKLRALGISQIYGGKHCTYQDERRFFSHRRATHQENLTSQGHISTGRMVSAIYLS